MSAHWVTFLTFGIMSQIFFLMQQEDQGMLQ